MLHDVFSTNINIGDHCLLLQYLCSNKSFNKDLNNQTTVDQLFTLNLLTVFQPDYNKPTIMGFKLDYTPEQVFLDLAYSY